MWLARVDEDPQTHAIAGLSTGLFFWQGKKVFFWGPTPPKQLPQDTVAQESGLWLRERHPHQHPVIDPPGGIQSLQHPDLLGLYCCWAVWSPMRKSYMADMVSAPHPPRNSTWAINDLTKVSRNSLESNRCCINKFNVNNINLLTEIFNIGAPQQHLHKPHKGTLLQATIISAVYQLGCGSLSQLAPVTSTTASNWHLHSGPWYASTC